jgi:cytochrome c
MLKINKKILIGATLTSSLALLTACGGSDWSPTPSIDGGVYYPSKNGKTGPYYVNEDYKNLNINHGRVPTENELKAWDKDIMGKRTGNEGLPEGSGTVEEGEELYEAQCVMCHGDFGSGGGGYPSLSKGNAYDLKKTLTNQRNVEGNDGPIRVFGSYWPEASTMFWYIRDAMPHTKSKTLTDDETYALTAYMLYINEMEVDGELVDEEYELNREKFLKIEMPNKDGFIPNIEGPTGPKDVTEFYKDPNNYGAIKVGVNGERCMSNCQEESAEVVYIKYGGISDFHPAMSVERTLPGESGSAAHKVTFDAKAAYEENCTACHGMLDTAPAAGDKAGWKPILAKGLKNVYKRALEGTENGMPAKGGSSLSDDEFKKVVDYMLQ